MGQTVNYSFTITNTGDAPLANVSVTDTQTAPAGPLTKAPSCPQATLAVGASEACTASYTVTETDLNNGSIDDSATATGDAPSGSPVTSTPSTARVITAQTPAITIQKTATPATVNTVGQVVTYSFLVTNTGNVALSKVAVADAQAAPAGPLTGGPTCPQSTLAAGASEMCTATYAVTQADLAHGSIDDSATATGTDSAGMPVTSAPAAAKVATVVVAGGGQHLCRQDGEPDHGECPRPDGHL